MYCAKCEFEIKGEGRKECPICGGPLIDFSSLASETPENKIETSEDQPADNSRKTHTETTFDLAGILNDHDKMSEKGLEPEAPPVEELPAENAESPLFEKTGETPDRSSRKSKESVPFDLESALTSEQEKHCPEPGAGQEKEDLFTFETALNEDEVKQGRESDIPAQTSSVPGHKTGPEPEADSKPPLEEVSTEELLRRIAEEYKLDVEKESPSAAPAPTLRGPKPVPVRSSRSISAIAALAICALMAAIASIAYLTPQEKLHPTIINLKTETEKKIEVLTDQLHPAIRNLKTEAEKKIDAITDLVILNVEKYLYQQEEPSSSIPRQKARPDRPVKRTSLAKKPPIQEKTVPVAMKPMAVTKIVPEENEKTAPKEPTQPPAETAKSIPPQDKPAPPVVEKKEKTPVKPTGTKSSRGSLYSLHTGSFTKESIAIAEAERLKRMGFNSYIQKVSLKNGQTWFRIKVGDFNTRQEAEDIQDKLTQKAPHIKAYIMKKSIEAKAPLPAEAAKDPKPVAEIPQAVVELLEEMSSPEKPV